MSELRGVVFPGASEARTAPIAPSRLAPRDRARQTLRGSLPAISISIQSRSQLLPCLLSIAETRLLSGADISPQPARWVCGPTPPAVHQGHLHCTVSIEDPHLKRELHPRTG